MELPHLGKHCAEPSCKILDFLPVKCSWCKNVFCKDHYPSARHSCPDANVHDKQVPVCPLCGAVVPLRPGEPPDIPVGRHMDTACRSKPALELKGKIFTNTCAVRGCKKKELVPFRCVRCRANFCISHRSEMDHNCKGFQVNQNGIRQHLSPAGAAAIFRHVFGHSAANTSNSPPAASQERPTIKEGTSVGNPTTVSRTEQEEQDYQLALSLAYAEEDNAHTSRNQRINSTPTSPSGCIVS